LGDEGKGKKDDKDDAMHVRIRTDCVRRSEGEERKIQDPGSEHQTVS